MDNSGSKGSKLKDPKRDLNYTPSKWDMALMKKKCTKIVYAYVGDAVHSVFVVERQQDFEGVREVLSTLRPSITKVVDYPPSAERWKFVEDHQDDDLGYDTFDENTQRWLFNNGKVILWLDTDFIIKE